jgi:hypothetical protein
MQTDLATVPLPAARLTAGVARSPAATVPDAVAAVPSQAVPNPRLRLDGALGMVVIEFRDTAGQVDRSIPTPREIAAYRAVARGGDPLASRDEPKAEPALPAPDTAPPA